MGAEKKMWLTVPFIDFPNIPQSIHVCTQINELKLRSTGVSGRFSALHFRCAYLHRMHLLKFADALQLYVYLLLAVSLPSLHMLSYCPDPEPWPGCESSRASLFFVCPWIATLRCWLLSLLVRWCRVKKSLNWTVWFLAFWSILFENGMQFNSSGVPGLALANGRK